MIRISCTHQNSFNLDSESLFPTKLKPSDKTCEENKFHLPTTSCIYDVVDVGFSWFLKIYSYS